MLSAKAQTDSVVKGLSALFYRTVRPFHTCVTRELYSKSTNGVRKMVYGDSNHSYGISFSGFYLGQRVVWTLVSDYPHGTVVGGWSGMVTVDFDSQRGRVDTDPNNLKDETLYNRYYRSEDRFQTQTEVIDPKIIADFL